MSWFTIAARHAGLGGLMDAIGGLFKSPSIANAAAAGAALVQAAPHVATIAPDVVTQMASDTVAAALTKVAPSAEPIAMEFVAPFLAEVEAAATKYLSTVLPDQQTDPQPQQ